MNSTLYQKIEQSTAHVKSRTSVSNFAMKSEENLSELISIAFDINHDLHVKAFWSLDLIGEKKLKLLVPYLDEFCKVLPHIKEDSSLRPATRIAMYLVKSNHRKNGNNLTKEQALELAINYPFSGGEIDNIVRKCIMENVLHGEQPSLKTILSFCNQEKWEASTMGNKIGY